MIALQDFSTAAPVSQMLPSFAPLELPKRSKTASHSAPQRKPVLKCGTAAELKRYIAGDFAAAKDWFTLCRGLRRKGFCLRMRGEDLWLCDAARLRPVCSCEDLGIDPEELELRFGLSQQQRQPRPEPQTLAQPQRKPQAQQPVAKAA